MEKKYTVEFTQVELQTILNALVKEPYASVFNLMNSIQTQIAPQIETSKVEKNESN